MHYQVRKIPANIVVEPNGAVSRYRNRVLDHLPAGADCGGPNYIYFAPGEQHRQVVYVKKIKDCDFEYPDEPDAIDFDVVTCPFNYKDVLKDYDWPFEEAAKKSTLRRKFHVSLHYAYAKGCVDPSGKYIWMGDVESAKKHSATAALNDANK
ncbi:hypothetical protein AAVH_03290 [Aphelenchoides avenae]|nr:hypothetical protein AAVH_03290 [Aphelenchus avenae]